MSLSLTVTSKRLYQRQIPLLLVSIIAGIFIVEYFTVPASAISPYEVAVRGIKNELTQWSTILASFVLLYAFVVLIIGQTRTLLRVKEPKRKRNSAVCLGALVFFYLLGYILPGGPSNTSYQTMFMYLVAYAAASWNIPWSLGGAYACYRYLRPTSLESAVMVTAVLFSMFRGSTLLVAIWPPFYDIGVWIETVVATSVIRAFVTAAAVGTVVLTVRALVGREPGLIELEVV